MRLKCDRCGWITDYEFPTREIQLHANDGCVECGFRLLKESEIQQALILSDLEDKWLIAPIKDKSSTDTGIFFNEAV